MGEYTITFTKTRAVNGARVYLETIQANSIKEAIDKFYSLYPRYHILGRINGVQLPQENST